MNHAFYIIIAKFGEDVGMKSEFAEAEFGITIAVVVAALILCIFGIKYFKISAGISMFFISAILVMRIMGNADKGAKTIAFIMIGLLLTVITLRKYRIGAFTMSVLIGYSLAASIGSGPKTIYITIVFLVILTYLYPVYGLWILTAIWGGMTLAIDGLALLNMNLSVTMTTIIGVLFILIGLAVQWITSIELMKMSVKERSLYVIK